MNQLQVFDDHVVDGDSEFASRSSRRAFEPNYGTPDEPALLTYCIRRSSADMMAIYRVEIPRGSAGHHYSCEN